MHSTCYTSDFNKYNIVLNIQFSHIYFFLIYPFTSSFSKIAKKKKFDDFFCNQKKNTNILFYKTNKYLIHSHTGCVRLCSCLCENTIFQLKKQIKFFLI